MPPSQGNKAFAVMGLRGQRMRGSEEPHSAMQAAS